MKNMETKKQEEKTKLKKKIIQMSCICLYLGGIIIFSYPDIRAVENSIRNNKVIREFEEHLVSSEESGRESGTESHEETKTDESDSLPFGELRTVMEDYNRRIYMERQENLEDPWSYEQSSIDLSEYGVENDVVGIISIPKMDVELPIYLGASQENMKSGAVLLGQTSFPLGENNSNSVIAAHRGWKGIPMFREIEKLSLGDNVTIQNFWETLTYEVTEIRVIMPEDVNEILIQDNRNMVTLLTCHPYTQDTRRYVVFCERVSSAEEEKENGKSAVTGRMSEKMEVGEKINISEEQEDTAVIRREKTVRSVGYVILGIVGIMLIVIIYKNGKDGGRTEK